MYIMLGTHQHARGIGRQALRGYLPAARARRRMSGLGANTSAVVSSSLATAAAVDPEPISKAVLAIVAGLASVFHIGQGCGQPCVDAAKAEQVFEAAADNILSAGNAGMLSASDAVAAMEYILAQGDQTMSQFTTKQGAAGKTNMDKVIANEISLAQGLPAAQSSPLDPTKLQSLFIAPGASGWYSDSLSSAETIAAESITQLPDYQQLSSGTASASSATSGIAATISQNPALALAGLGVVGFLLFQSFLSRREDAN